MTAAMTLFDPDALGGPDDARRDDPAPPADAPPPLADAPPPPTDPAPRRLTPDQEAAVQERSRSLLLSASAGSGKTSVLVERFVRAVLDDGIEPSRILAITFTDKAAGELRERIRATLQGLATPAARAAARATEGAFVSTIHGFCARLLRAHPLAAGLDPGFSVLDEPRAARLRDEAFAAALRAFLAGPHARDALDLVAAYRTDALAFAIPVVHDELRSRGASHPRLPQTAPAPRAGRGADCAGRGPHRARGGARGRAATPSSSATRARRSTAAPASSRTSRRASSPGRAGSPRSTSPAGAPPALRHRGVPRLRRGARRLRARLRRPSRGPPHRAARRAARRLRHRVRRAQARRAARSTSTTSSCAPATCCASAPAIRAAWRDRFELLMVDEFQDTNRRQLEVLEALERRRPVHASATSSSRSTGSATPTSASSASAATRCAERGLRPAPARRASAARRGSSPRSTRRSPGRFGEAFAPLRPFAPTAETRHAARSTCSSPTRAAGTPTRSTSATRLPPGAGLAAGRGAAAGAAPARARRLGRGRARRDRCARARRRVHAGRSSARSRTPACRPSPAPAAASGRARRSSTSWATSRALANPLDERALLDASSPRRCAGSPRMPSRCSAPQPASSGRASGRCSARRPPPTRAPASAEPDARPASGGRSCRPPMPSALDAFLARFAAQRAAAPRLALDEVLDRRDRARRATTPGSSGWSAARGGWRTSTSCCGWRAGSRRPRGATCAASSTTRRPSSRRRSASPRRPVEDPDVDAVRLMTVHAAKGLEFDVVAIADLGRRPPITPPRAAGRRRARRACG